jgi:CubicO group peptidase (beta-lactamase class C family)/tetratricopeptide (TPR) repeat protein
MADQTRAAWEAFVRAECKDKPVVIVLEDLHWGDGPTVGHVDWVLARLADEPLFVLALARPEVHGQFPTLFRGAEELRLAPLPRKAAERLVAHALGAAGAGETAERIVSLAVGNAFYLEELIRSVAEGRSDLPESVLAMAHVRYEGLEAPARQLLRAAAVLGEVFWRGALFHLVPQLEGQGGLDHLSARELVEQRPDSRFRGDVEYRFRHALLRAAAYAALTPSDRTTGHRLAAEWLEAAGERDPLTLAEHLERAGEAERAVAWYRRAAEHALDGGDFAAAQARAARAIACGAAGDDRIALELVDLEALKWQGDYRAMAGRAAELAQRVPRGAPSWCRAIGDVYGTLGAAARPGELAEIEVVLTELDVAAEAVPSFLVCAARVLTRSYTFLRVAEVAPLHEKIEAIAARAVPLEPVLAAWLRQAGAYRAAAHDRIDESLRLFGAARARFAEAGDRRGALASQVDEGHNLVELGDYRAAEQRIVDGLPAMEALRLVRLLPHAYGVLAMALMLTGRADEAVALMARADAIFQRVPTVHPLHPTGLQILANAHRLAGDLTAAERVARASLALAERVGLVFHDARPVLAQVLLARGRPDEALACLGPPSPPVVLSYSEGGQYLHRLTRAEALAALGRTDEARTAIAEAKRHVDAHAAAISDAALRKSFVERVADVCAIPRAGGGVGRRGLSRPPATPAPRLRRARTLRDPRLLDGHRPCTTSSHVDRPWLRGTRLRGSPGRIPAHFTRRGEIGAAVAAYWRGAKVVDLWGGRRTPDGTAPWTEDTLAVVMSSSKGLSALALAVANARGWLDYEAPVARYWPEFAENGKGAITVRQLLGHEAGLVLIDEKMTIARMRDLDEIARLLARQRPAWPPGTRHGYHTMSLGLYMQELIRHADPARRTLGGFFHEEIAAPLGLDLYIGLPRDIPDERLAKMKTLSIARALLALPRTPPALIRKMLQPGSLLRRSMLFTDLDWNDRRSLEVELPAGNAVGTARAIARAYAAFADGGAELGITAETMAHLTAPAVAGKDEVIGLPSCFALGFMRPGPGFTFGSSPRTFGAPGAGGSFAFADPDCRLGYAYVMNKMGYYLADDPRERALRDAIYRGIGAAAPTRAA